MSMEYRKRYGFMPDPRVAQDIQRLDAQADCQHIVQLLAGFEFSWDFMRALELALFYTYGSASVSRLLDRTGEFRDHGQKRYDDTRLLIAHFIHSGWDGDFGRRAIARINQTHGHYRIPNDDFLFVLWTFIEFPIRWTREFGHRAMTPHEQLAWFNFWAEIGRRMNIQDIPASLSAFNDWTEDYMAREFHPDPASARVAQATIRILEGWFPHPLRAPIGPAVHSFFEHDHRFLAAIQAPRPPAALGAAVRRSLMLLGRLKRRWAPGDYPLQLDSPINRTYPDHNYRIEALQPVHLQRREAQAQAKTG